MRVVIADLKGRGGFCQIKTQLLEATGRDSEVSHGQPAGWSGREDYFRTCRASMQAIWPRSLKSGPRCPHYQ